MVNKMALMGKGLNNPQSDIKKKKKKIAHLHLSVGKLARFLLLLLIGLVCMRQEPSII